jgi:hypothetical protein
VKKNIGKKDRLLRLAIAILLLVYAIWQRSYIAFAAFLFTMYEVLASWCVLYHFIGKNTCNIRKK